jgi:predicted NUDIX family phosphoesterase
MLKTNLKWEEIIIVVNRKKLFNNEELAFQGVTKDQELIDKIMYNIDMYYKSMRRGNEKDPTPKTRNAEINTDFKQPIPYIVIRRGNEFFVTERLEGAGEGRLHGKLSLGAGGHMNPLDSDSWSFDIVLHENTERELSEELEIVAGDEVYPKIIGLINDDSEPVSQVHLGILGITDLKEDATVTVRETEQLAGHWISLEELKSEEVYDRLENWSKIVVDIL